MDCCRVNIADPFAVALIVDDATHDAITVMVEHC